MEVPSSNPHSPVKASISSSGTGLFQSAMASFLSSMFELPHKKTQWSGYIFIALKVRSGLTEPLIMKVPLVSTPLAVIYPVSDCTLNFSNTISWLLSSPSDHSPLN